MKLGHVPGPEMLVSPGHIRPKPGMAFFMVYPEFADAIDGELRGPDRIAAATRALMSKGRTSSRSARASVRASRTRTRAVELTEDEMRAAVTEAAQKGLTSPRIRTRARAAPMPCAPACAASSTAPGWTSETLAGDEAPRHVLRADAGGHERRSPIRAATRTMTSTLRLRTQSMMGPLRAAVRKAHAMGVPIVASTDGSYAEDDIGRMRVAHDIALCANSAA